MKTQQNLRDTAKAVLRPSFLRILDALVVAVKAPVVRLDGARLDDDERQAGWSRWNHHHHVQAVMTDLGKINTRHLS